MGVKLFKEMLVQLMSEMLVDTYTHMHAHARTHSHTHLNASELMPARVSRHTHTHLNASAIFPPTQQLFVLCLPCGPQHICILSPDLLRRKTAETFCKTEDLTPFVCTFHASLTVTRG